MGAYFGFALELHIHKKKKINTLSSFDYLNQLCSARTKIQNRCTSQGSPGPSLQNAAIGNIVGGFTNKYPDHVFAKCLNWQWIEFRYSKSVIMNIIIHHLVGACICPIQLEMCFSLHIPTRPETPSESGVTAISFTSSCSSCWGSSDSRSCWRVGWGWHSRKTHRHSWSLGSHTQWRGCSPCELSAGQTGAETTVRRTLFKNNLLRYLRS